MYQSMTIGENQMPASNSSSKSKLSMIQEKGQVTIPAEIRKKLGLK